MVCNTETEFNRANLHRLKLVPPDYVKVQSHQKLVNLSAKQKGNIVDLKLGPDGYLYASTSNKILQLSV